MQCDGRLADFGGCKGQSAPGIGIRGVDSSGAGECGRSLAILLLTNQVLPICGIQAGIGGMGGNELGVELVGLGRFAGLGEHFEPACG